MNHLPGNHFPGRASALLFGFLAAVLSGPQPAYADFDGTTRVASGLTQPVFATFAPGDKDRLFVVEKGGAIRIVDLPTKTVLQSPFLTINDTDPENEGGLLGMAFHPNYQENGKFYVYVTVDNGNVQIDNVQSPYSSHIREYTAATPNVADQFSEKEVLNWVQPRNNHNGGWVGFSPNDGHLYITSGDGGKQGDPDNNAQTLTGDFLGKVLRIDVNGDDFPTDDDRNYAIPGSNPFVGVAGDDEIWSYGLRNPYRASFDRLTGDMWIADVGHGSREEIDFQAGDSPGGDNYAWRRREGFNSFGGALLPTDTEPVYDYGHGSGDFQGNSVTGGYVYRGPDPHSRGDYVFADFISRNVWNFDPQNPTSTVANINDDLTPDVGSIGNISGFGEDYDGNLYVIDYGGELFRIDTDIQLLGDYNGNGSVGDEDFDLWLASYGATGPGLATDGNGDGVVDSIDYAVWRENFGRSIVGAASTAPEPAALACLLVGLLASGEWRRQR